MLKTQSSYFTGRIQPGSNTANYNNTEFNRLYRASSSMQPSPMRTSIYRNMSRIVTGDCVTISGVSRRLILLWNRDLAMVPDRSFLGGFFLRFVGSKPDDPATGSTVP